MRYVFQYLLRIEVNIYIIYRSFETVFFLSNRERLNNSGESIDKMCQYESVCILIRVSRFFFYYLLRSTILYPADLKITVIMRQC